jgi:hypothetical protein
MRPAILLLALCAACAGSKHEKSTSEPIAAQVYDDHPAPAPAAKLSEAECTRLFDHVAELMEKGMPPEEWTAGKDDLAAERPGMIKDCQDGETTRVQLDCMMAAGDLAGLGKCVPAK